MHAKYHAYYRTHPNKYILYIISSLMVYGTVNLGSIVTTDW